MIRLKRGLKDLNTGFKRALFDYHLLLLLIALLIAGAWFLFFSAGGREELNLLLTILGVLVSFFYFVQKQQLEELNHFKELFNYFNKIYDGLNEKLNRIAKPNSKSR